MKLMISAIISLVAVAAFANEPKKATTTTTTTAPAAATAPTAPAAATTTTTTTKEEKKAAHATVDCKDKKNADKAECKSTH